MREPATRLKCTGRCIRKKPGCGRPVLPSASSEALGPTSHQEATSHQEVETKIFALKSSSFLEIYGVLNHKIQAYEYKVPPLRGKLFGNLGEFWSKAPEQGEKFSLSGDQGWSIVVDRGGRPGKSRLWKFKGERYNERLR